MTQDQRILAKVDLLIELTLTVRCLEFYTWSRILGFIPDHLGSSTQVRV